MNELKVGSYVASTSGHDYGKCYVIFQIDSEYVYLVDGSIRTLNNMKKKKKKHVKMIDLPVSTLENKIIKKTIRDEEIKRAIKLLRL
jgi:ribosomal protein L14E/L6E/L27E